MAFRTTGMILILAFVLMTPLALAFSSEQGCCGRVAMESNCSDCASECCPATPAAPLLFFSAGEEFRFLSGQTSMPAMLIAFSTRSESPPSPPPRFL